MSPWTASPQCSPPRSSWSLEVGVLLLLLLLLLLSWRRSAVREAPPGITRVLMLETRALSVASCRHVQHFHVSLLHAASLSVHAGGRGSSAANAIRQVDGSGDSPSDVEGTAAHGSGTCPLEHSCCHIRRQ